MEQFGTLNGKPVELIRLREGGLSCEILTYGATLRKLTVPDRDGKPRDVVLGFDTLEEYIHHDCYFGAVIGPVANRIGGARCKLNGKVLVNDRRYTASTTFLVNDDTVTGERDASGRLAEDLARQIVDDALSLKW